MTGILRLTCFALVLIFAKGQEDSNEPAKLSFGLRELIIGGRLSNIPAELYKERRGSDEWTLISQTVSTASGVKFPITAAQFRKGNYRVLYYMEEYYASQNLTTFYPHVEVVFEKTTNANEEYTVPVLVSPFGYTMYRGSA